MANLTFFLKYIRLLIIFAFLSPYGNATAATIGSILPGPLPELPPPNYYLWLATKSSTIGAASASGTITMNPAPDPTALLMCNVDTGACRYVYHAVTHVTLTAVPDEGSFEGWSGDGCSGNNPTCTITVYSTPRSVTANFYKVIPLPHSSIGGKISPAFAGAYISTNDCVGNVCADATTLPDGSYVMIANPGTWSLTVSASGCVTKTITGVVVVTNVMTPVNPSLTCYCSTPYLDPIDPINALFNSVSNTGTVTVSPTSGTCSWTATSNDTWILPTAGWAGKGNGTVSYLVYANTDTTSRTGTMTIAGKTFTVKQKASQTIGTFSFSPPALAVGGTTTASATATSWEAVAFSSLTPFVCSVSGNTITGLTVGTCTVAANQAGSADYDAAAQVTGSIAVGKGSQTIGAISFILATLAVGGTTTVSATATSDLPVAFNPLTTSVCTVSGNTVTGMVAGTCTIAANQVGSENYYAAVQVTNNITVNKVNQTIGTVTFNPTSLAVGGTTTVSATVSSSLAVTFSSLTTSVCAVSGSTVTGVAAGTCTVAANQSGNTTYNAAPQVTNNITVGKANQTIGTISFSPTTLTVGSTATASAIATSGLTVTFSSLTTAVCTVIGSTVTGVTAGTCTVAANQGGNANYDATTQVTNSITVGKANQTIDAIIFTPNSLDVGGITTASAMATLGPGLAVTFSSLTTSVCSVSGSTVTGIAAGTCTVAANQSGNANFDAATQVSQNIILSSTKVPCDLNGDGEVTMADAIIALQIMAGIQSPGLRSDYATSGAAVNGYGKIGQAELIYILQKVARIR
jgi:hypothetical protein